MWQRWAQSRRRCGSGEPSPGTDVGRGDLCRCRGLVVVAQNDAHVVEDHVPAIPSRGKAKVLKAINRCRQHENGGSDRSAVRSAMCARAFTFTELITARTVLIRALMLRARILIILSMVPIILSMVPIILLTVLIILSTVPIIL
jgi:hypothetical protein